ncbi:MAG: hypothetical protein LAO78_12235 [Acidobacteriia bacterium]|nr:hypothetical protein [Terriglobia bacterium]
MAKNVTKATAKKAIPATPVVIQSLRLSLIWAELLPDFLRSNVPLASPFGPLPRDFLFEKTFETARDGASTNPKFEVPWLRERKQKFWMRYMVQGKLSQVKGSQAWNYLVPLRLDTGIRVTANGFKGDVFIDAFYYPFGTAVVISLRWDPNLALNQITGDVYSVYKNGKFSVANGPQQAALEDVVDYIFETMRERALGKTSESVFRTPEPFSLLTVIQATGVNPNADVRKDTPVMETLEALTSWPANPSNLTLPDLNKACLPSKGHSPLGSALFSERRGRAVWIPTLFGVNQPPSQFQAPAQARLSSKLGCYHRNLLFASLQIESLGRLLCYTSGLFAQGTRKADLPAGHRDLVENAALQLAKLYKGLRDDTWRSASAQRQILENCFTCLQTVLGEFQHEKLPDPDAKPAAPTGPTTKPA